ncbi:MAG: endonuclease/exonuclease/phosphatase family protein [Burkholderiales bacterium]
MALAVAATLVAACATVPDGERAWTASAGGPVPARCPPPPDAGPVVGEVDTRAPFLVVSWNIHKSARAGWESDLARFLAAGEFVLLQESLLGSAMRERLERAGARWVQAEAWSARAGPTGALIASRVAPARHCVLRQAEPPGIPPKSAVVAWYRLAGRADTLAVASVHSVNFSPGLAAYRRQLESLAATLADHRGPVVVGGDFNTWSPVRAALVDEILAGVGLAPIVPVVDRRSRFLGLPADHLYVRGLVAVDAAVASLDSSDHVPIVAALAFPPR